MEWYWGAPPARRYAKRCTRGIQLADWMLGQRISIINNGIPTRWHQKKLSNGRKRISESWIDASLQKGFPAGMVKQWVNRTPLGSDHYPIFINVNELKMDTPDAIEDQSITWKFHGPRMEEMHGKIPR